jgi:hypothetical protein
MPVQGFDQSGDRFLMAEVEESPGRPVDFVL